MPNHFHGIIIFVGALLVGAHSSETTIYNAENRAGTRPAPTLGDAVGAFKSRLFCGRSSLLKSDRNSS